MLDKSKSSDKIGKTAVFGLVAVLTAAIVIVFILKSKDAGTVDSGNTTTGTNATATASGDNKSIPDSTADPKREPVFALMIEPAKQSYKLGEPVIINVTLKKTGGPAKVLEMRELVNIFAEGYIEEEGTGIKRKLMSPIGVFVIENTANVRVWKGTGITTDEMNRYRELYGASLVVGNMEQFPTIKHVHDLPEGEQVLKAEIHLEKLAVLSHPGKITFALKYRNTTDYYFDEVLEIKLDIWQGTVDSISIILNIVQ
jgi:hypothetical protein